MSEYKFDYDKKTLYDLDWEKTVIGRLRNLIRVEQMMIFDEHGATLYEGPAEDVPDELLALKVIEEDCGECIRPWHDDSLIVGLKFTCSGERVSAIDLANACYELHHQKAGVKYSLDEERSLYRRRHSLIEGACKLAILKAEYKRDKCAMRELVAELVANIGYALDDPKLIKLGEKSPRDKDLIYYEEDEEYDY